MPAFTSMTSTGCSVPSLNNTQDKNPAEPGLCDKDELDKILLNTSLQSLEFCELYSDELDSHLCPLSGEA